MKTFRIGFENGQGYQHINLQADTIEEAHSKFCAMYKNAKKYIRTITLIGA